MVMSADSHLTADQTAGFVDRLLPPAERAGVEAHLSVCADCRKEVRAVGTIVRASPWTRWRPAAAAGALAASLFFVIWAVGGPGAGPSDPLREGVTPSPLAPVPVRPLGATDAPRALVWSAVPDAITYRVTVFDSVGHALWEAETTDTTSAVPDSVAFAPRTPYFWKSEAQTGWGRWTASPLSEFSSMRPQ